MTATTYVYVCLCMCFNFHCLTCLSVHGKWNMVWYGTTVTMLVTLFVRNVIKSLPQSGGFMQWCRPSICVFICSPQEIYTYGGRVLMVLFAGLHGRALFWLAANSQAAWLLRWQQHSLHAWHSGIQHHRQQPFVEVQVPDITVKFWW